MKKLYLLFLLIIISAQYLLANSVKDSTVFASNRFAKTNPFKPFLGIVSIGYENILYKKFSLSIFAEYMVRDHLLMGNGSEHPAFVLQITPRFYTKEKEILHGFFVGTITGFTLKRKNTDQPQGIILGVESGYKFLLGKKKQLFLEPKILLTHNFSEQRVIIPGIEGHFGIRF